MDAGRPYSETPEYRYHRAVDALRRLREHVRVTRSDDYDPAPDEELVMRAISFASASDEAMLGASPLAGDGWTYAWHQWREAWRSWVGR